MACRGLVYVWVPGSLVASRRPAALKCAYASGCKPTCPAAGDARWIRLFAELGARRIALWPYLAPLAAKPLADLS